MKKSMLFAAAAVVAMASCTNEDFTGFQQAKNGEAAINFGSGTKKLTRSENIEGADAAALLDNNFVVYGAKTIPGDASPSVVEVFDHYNVNYYADTKNSTESNSANWEYVGQDVATNLTEVQVQTIKYWDYQSSQYDFVAYSKGKNPETIDKYFTKIDLANLGKDVSTQTPVFKTMDLRAEVLKELYVADLITAYKNSDYQNTVIPKFRRLGAKVRMGIYETVPGYSVANVKFYEKADASASSITPTLYSAEAKIATGEGTMSVYYPTVGSGNIENDDYNQAHIVFTPKNTDGTDYSKKLEFNNLEYTAKELDEITATEFLGRTSATATYAGITGADDSSADYKMILPTGTEGVVLNLKVDYDLYPIDGADEVIHVKGATAVIPSIYTEWQPNYAYTYLFKISDQTNGNTGTVGTDPAGLYPITFDAVVMGDEDGIQETITEIGQPSITTYQKGKVVTENDEYVAGDEIYVVVDNGVAMQKENFWAEGYVALYTGEIDDEALQTISEAASDNCFFYGGSTSPFTVIDANGRSFTLESATLDITGIIPAEDAPHGVEITKDNAIAKFSPTAGTTYVFQYLDEVADYEPAVGSTVEKGVTYYEVEMNDYANPTSWKITEHSTANNNAALGNEEIADKKVFKEAPTFTGEPETGTLAAGKHYYEKDAAGNYKYITAVGDEDCGTDKYYTGTPVAYTAGAVIGSTTSTTETIYYKKEGLSYKKQTLAAGAVYEVKTTDTDLYSFNPTVVTTSDCKTVKKGNTVYYYDETTGIAKKITAKGNEDTETGKYFKTYTEGTKFTDTDATTLTAGETYYTFATAGDLATEPTKLESAVGNEPVTNYYTLKTPAKYAYKVIRVAQ